MTACTTEPRSSLLIERPEHRPDSLRRLLSPVTGLFNLLFVWQERATERAHLASLDDRLLKDMGISRADVAQEIHKPFWRP